MNTASAVTWGVSMVSTGGMILSSIPIGTGAMAIGPTDGGPDTVRGTDGIAHGIMDGMTPGTLAITHSGIMTIGDGTVAATGPAQGIMAYPALVIMAMWRTVAALQLVASAVRAPVGLVSAAGLAVPQVPQGVGWALVREHARVVPLLVRDSAVHARQVALPQAPLRMGTAHARVP